MNRYERERPNTGGASAAVNYACNTGKLPPSWESWWYFPIMHHEMRRALLGIDPPTAWCGDRNARLRRMIMRWRDMPAVSLPG